MITDGKAEDILLKYLGIVLKILHLKKTWNGKIWEHTCMQGCRIITTVPLKLIVLIQHEYWQFVHF